MLNEDTGNPLTSGAPANSTILFEISPVPEPGTYGLMALGLSVIFGVVRVVNFAHGEFAVVGMYGAFILFTTLKIDPFIAMAPLAALFFVVGYGLQRRLVVHFIRRPDHEQFILLVGLAIIMVNGLLMIFGPDARHVDLPYSYDSWMLGPVLVDKVRAYAALAALGVAGALFAFFRYTQTGLAIRACADNLTGAAVVGLEIDKLYALTTHTAHWFVENGFHEVDVSELPAERRQLYNWQRRSKVFVKSGSKVSAAHLDNRVVGIIEYDGIRPEVFGFEDTSNSISNTNDDCGFFDIMLERC
jgi:hypothetical protein